MARHGYSGDALIEVLHQAQKLEGHLSKATLKQIAAKLKLPPSRVLGVATFYHLFRLEPRPPHTAVVCVGTACYAAGANELQRVARDHTSTPGGANWGVEIGRCVGSCGVAPVVVCDGQAMARVTPVKLRARMRQGSNTK